MAGEATSTRSRDSRRSLPEPYKYDLDPLDTLTFAAVCNSRIRLGTSVFDMPYYNPVSLARRLSTIDLLSKGRLNVGLGLGWFPDEMGPRAPT